MNRQSDTKKHAEKRSASALRKKRLESLPRGPIAAMLISLIAALGLLAWAWHKIHSDVSTPPIKSWPVTEETVTMFRTAGELMGDFLSMRYEGKSIEVLLPPEEYMLDVDHAFLSALVETTAAALAGLKMTHLPQTDSLLTPWYIPDAEVFNQIIHEKMDRQVILSVAGLPAFLEDVEFWRLDRQKTDLIVINTPVKRLKILIERGYIDAVMVRRPETDYPSPPPHSPEHWLIITVDNIKSVSDTYPRLFAK